MTQHENNGKTTGECGYETKQVSPDDMNSSWRNSKPDGRSPSDAGYETTQVSDRDMDNLWRRKANVCKNILTNDDEDNAMISAAQRINDIMETDDGIYEEDPVLSVSSRIKEIMDKDD